VGKFVPTAIGSVPCAIAFVHSQTARIAEKLLMLDEAPRKQPQLASS
jgi:hypothetical protein